VSSVTGFVNIARLFVILCWLGFFLPFLGRKKPARGKTERRAPVSQIGIVLQGLSFFPVWFFQARMFPSAALPELVLLVFCALAMLLAFGSVWMAVAAIRVLGKQWSFQARLVEGHRLVVAGPYSYVRHPIYTAMLGMLLATGFVFSVWWALPPSLVIFSIGTAIRVRAEERLLREAFGEDFEAYRKYVPAVIPRWKIR
jgi:protein-S-isoprenylcysteine O-methyltransferase Ste14